MRLYHGIRPKNTTALFVLDFTLAWVMFLLLAYAIHEYGHLISLELLGGKGAIMTWNITKSLINPSVEHGSLMVALMGGWAVMAVYMILFFIVEDLPEKLALAVMAIEQGVYGIGEALFHAGLQVSMFQVAFLGYMLGIVPIVFVFLRMFGHKRRLVKKIEYSYE